MNTAEQQVLAVIQRQTMATNAYLVTRLRDSLRREGMSDEEIEAVRRKFVVYVRTKRWRKRGRR